MSRLSLAAELIQDHMYELAIEILKKERKDDRAKYLLSLLYRFQDQYDDELRILEQIKNSNAYIKERKKWHTKPMNEKVVVRQQLHFPRNPNRIPLKEDVEKLCFITGGDRNYYHLIVECVESIRNTSLYKNCDIFVIDCGLSEEQKKYLEWELKVTKVYDPGWDIDVPETNQRNPQGIIEKKPTPIGYKCMVARPHMDQHFPGYKYYMWIDADAWVHDERTIDLYLEHAKTQGVGLTRHITFDTYNEQNIYFAPPVLSPENKKFLENKNAVIVSAFCIDATSTVFDEWRKNFLDNIEKQGFWWNTEEQTLGLTYHQRRSTLLVEHQHHAALVREGLPIVFDNDNILYSSKTGEVFGTIHMSSGKWHHYFPSQKRDKPITTNEEFQYHMTHFGWANQRNYCFKHRIEPYKLNIPNAHLVSCRFRVWPWKDKPEIKALLRDETRKILEEKCHA